MIYILTAETVPTEIRTLSISTASMATRIGAMIAPFVALLVGSFDNNMNQNSNNVEGRSHGVIIYIIGDYYKIRILCLLIAGRQWQ